MWKPMTGDHPPALPPFRLSAFPSLPYVAPFATFMLLLELGRWLPAETPTFEVVRVTVLILVLWLCSRSVITLEAPHWFTSIALGIGVFAIWIAPDVLIPNWRESPFFQNGLTGRVEGTLSPTARSDPLVLTLRFERAVLLVPIIEELFWRAWLPRWIDRRDDFREIPLGSYSRASFLLTALLFASEHGAVWDVGLAAGLLYNWWMRRTRKLGNLILAHAVTNACLSLYVLARGRWEYW
jgi:CAAX prenyl protease-like protein